MSTKKVAKGNPGKDRLAYEIDIRKQEYEKLRESLKKCTEPCEAKPANPQLFPSHKQDYKPQQETLISFESGHYKAFRGSWKGDSVWAHFTTADGRTIHVNKDKVEYIQTAP